VFFNAILVRFGGTTMDKFKADLSEIQKMLDTNRLPVSGNEHRMVRVAFDFFRLDGDETDDLWEVQSADDGEFLVRTYSLPEETEEIKTSSWSVTADKEYANLTIAYQGVPITRLASKDYGAETLEDGKLLQGVVFNKLATDVEFIKTMILSLPASKKVALLRAFAICDECEEEQDAGDDATGKKLEQWKQMSLEDKSMAIPGWDSMPYHQLAEEVNKLPLVTMEPVKVHPTERQEAWIEAQRKRELAKQWAAKVKKQKELERERKTVPIYTGKDPLEGIEPAKPGDYADDIDPILAALEIRLAKGKTCPQCKKSQKDCKCFPPIENTCPECTEFLWKCKCKR
jgi:hypothetical protein